MADDYAAITAALDEYARLSRRCDELQTMLGAVNAACPAYISVDGCMSPPLAVAQSTAAMLVQQALTAAQAQRSQISAALEAMKGLAP